MAKKLGIIGAGAWGTALSMQAAKNGHEILLWDIDEKVINEINNHQKTPRLPGISFPNKIKGTTNLSDAVLESDLLLVVVPSKFFEETINKIKVIKPNISKIIWATKGLSANHRPLHEIIQKAFGENSNLALIAGPNFAKEVADNKPTAVLCASNNLLFADEVSSIFHNDTFRVYTSSDILGVEISGAVKNVLAIAVGISDGLGFGANTKCALITRGLVELKRLGLALGGKDATFTGLTGLGDLVLTSTDDQSRNRRFGLLVGQFNSVLQAQEHLDYLVEGIPNAKTVHDLAKQHEIVMPISEAIYQVLYENLKPSDIVKILLRRPKTFE